VCRPVTCCISSDHDHDHVATHYAQETSPHLTKPSCDQLLTPFLPTLPTRFPCCGSSASCPSTRPSSSRCEWGPFWAVAVKAGCCTVRDSRAASAPPELVYMTMAHNRSGEL
jgi:hypothetical protein